MTLALAHASQAQGFVSPFIGYNFEGDSGCPEISDCEDKKLNLGVSFGSLRSVFGTEFEIAHASNFFGKTPGITSSVLTAMGSVMLVPKFGPVQLYGLVGLGLLKSRVEFTTSGLLDTSNNDLGWDAGGGLIIFFGDHVGVRGDVRHFHAFQDLEILGLKIADSKLDFGRASGGLVVKF